MGRDVQNRTCSSNCRVHWSLRRILTGNNQNRLGGFVARELRSCSTHHRSLSQPEKKRPLLTGKHRFNGIITNHHQRTIHKHPDIHVSTKEAACPRHSCVDETQPLLLRCIEKKQVRELPLHDQAARVLLTRVVNTRSLRYAMTHVPSWPSCRTSCSELTALGTYPPNR